MESRCIMLKTFLRHYANALFVNHCHLTIRAKAHCTIYPKPPPCQQLDRLGLFYWCWTAVFFTLADESLELEFLGVSDLLTISTTMAR